MVRRIQEVTQSGSIGQHKNTNTTTIIPNKNINNSDEFDLIFKNKIRKKTKYELNKDNK